MNRARNALLAVAVVLLSGLGALLMTDPIDAQPFGAYYAAMADDPTPLIDTISSQFQR